jgi:hypothetical protein
MFNLLKLFYILVSLPTQQAQEVSEKFSIWLAGVGTREKNHVCITFLGYCTWVSSFIAVHT